MDSKTSWGQREGSKRIPGSGTFLAKPESASETEALGMGWTAFRAYLFSLRIERHLPALLPSAGVPLPSLAWPLGEARLCSGLPTTPSLPLSISVPTASWQD